MTAPKAEGEMLLGANAIAAFLGVKPRQVYHLIVTGALPHWRQGKTLAARRATLRIWVDEREDSGRAQRGGARRTSAQIAIAPDWHDTLTVLRARGRRLAKQVTAGGDLLDYDNARTFDAATVRVAGLIPLHDILKQLLAKRECCVVRGQLVGGPSATGIRRLLHRCTETGDAPTVCDVPRRWLALDCEGVTLPDEIPAADLERAADYVMGRLPRVFASTACIAQATSGHGLKPDARLRLWYWCDRPMSGAELRRWLHGTPCDESVFVANQVIYTAAPLFMGGREDHLPTRIMYLDGLAWLSCPSVEELAAPPPQPAAERAGDVSEVVSDAYASAALAGACDAIIDAGEGHRHRTLISESSNMARLMVAGLLTRGKIFDALTTAARQAGKSDGREIAQAIGWGLDNPAEGKMPRGSRAR